MPVTVIVGGQFGGEGKGKVAHYLAKETNATAVVRIGGPNSGHTVIDLTGSPLILRHLPTASILPDIICILGPGSYISPDILFDEISRTGLEHHRLLIDPNAMIITDKEVQEEESSSLGKSIGSTMSGTGAAVRKRIRRDKDTLLAKDDKRLKSFVRPTTPYLREVLDKGERVIIEGTQGFGLSLLHSNCYPYVTSRDTIAAAFVSEAGLSPLDVDDVVLVLRAFPIRVAGNSGPLPHEIDWDSLTKEAGLVKPVSEKTSVTKTTRRVAYFESEVVRQAISVNQPSCIALNHLDYIEGLHSNSVELHSKTSKFIELVESQIDKKINLLGFGPASLENCSRRINNLKIAK